MRRIKNGNGKWRRRRNLEGIERIRGFSNRRLGNLFEIARGGGFGGMRELMNLMQFQSRFQCILESIHSMTSVLITQERGGKGKNVRLERKLVGGKLALLDLDSGILR